jgi:glycosyltransferase involved in cell wall biosynthesis
MMPLSRSIARFAGVPVHLVIRKSLSADRRQLGWVPDHGGDAKVTLLDEIDWRAQCDSIFDENRHAIHLIAGYQRHAFLRYACFGAIERRCRFFVLSEAPLNMETGLRRPLKEIYLRKVVSLRNSSIIQAAERVFCLSGRRYQPLERVGWPTKKIVPFGYFPADLGRRTSSIQREDHPLRLICMGFLRRYKGVDLLLRAVSTLQRSAVKVTCEITGDGPELTALTRLVRDLRIEASVRFHGIVSDVALNNLIESSDVLVVPGLTEPWGIRINEGIQAGLAVVSSDRVGAADLINFSGAGLVFRSGDESELADCINSLATSPELLASAQSAARAYRSWIEPELAAKYLLQVLKLDATQFAPVPPWASAQARLAVSKEVSSSLTGLSRIA